jgi:hypothetical protein
MINTSSKTLETQEKTQEIKQVQGTKMEPSRTPRLWRYKQRRSSVEVTRHGSYEDQTHSFSCSTTTALDTMTRRWKIEVIGRDDGTVHHHAYLISMTGCDRWMTEHTREQRPIDSREVPKRHKRDRTRPIGDDRTRQWVRSALALQRSATVALTVVRDRTHPVKTTAASGH